MELSCTLIPKFQSTPPRGGRRETIRVVTPFVMHFNPRPREGGDSRPKHSPSPRSYFNPRPREGGDHLEWKGVYGCRISIHAPARGATKLRQYLSTIQTISIHAPARGATFGGRLEDFRPKFQSTPPRGGRPRPVRAMRRTRYFNPRPREGGDSKDAQFYLRIFDKQGELLRFLGKIRGGCLRNPEKDRRFLGESLANLPAISGHLDFAGGGKARPGYPCAVPLPHRAACVRGSGDPPADRCSSYRNAPLFSHIASPDSKSADCLSQNP